MRWNKRRLRVVGHLKFQVLSEESLIWASFWEARIREADKLAPWVAQDADEHEPWVELEEGDGTTTVTLMIYPQFPVYSRQLDAFHRYICRIAQHISNIGIDGLGYIELSMTVTEDQSELFYTSAGKELADLVKDHVGSFFENAE